MELSKLLVFVVAMGFSLATYAQEAQVENETTIDKKTYYQKRAMEDAQYEQKFNAESKDEEEAFWKEQKQYEKDLKKRDRKAYKAYMREKNDAYASNYEHCVHHCHHSDYYYHHASFYYYRYERHPRRSNTIKTNIRVSTPKVRLGIGIF